MLKIGDRVNTPHGWGEVVTFEPYTRLGSDARRYGIKLDVNPFDFPVAFYFISELKYSLPKINE